MGSEIHACEGQGACQAWDLCRGWGSRFAHQPEERMSYAAGGGRWDEPRARHLGAGAHASVPACRMVLEQAMLSLLPPCRTHRSPYPWFLNLQPKLSPLQLQPLQFGLPRGFIFPLVEQSWDEPPPPRDRCPLPTSPSPPFSLGSRVAASASRGDHHYLESSDGEFGKNSPPGWLLLPSSAGGWS